MTDPRVDRHAKVLVNYCVKAEKGDRILVEGTPQAEPLIRAVFRRLLEAGAHPVLALTLTGLETSAGVDDVFMAEASDEQLGFTPPLVLQAYQAFEGRIRIHSQNNTKALTTIDPSRMARRAAGLAPILRAQFERGGAGEFKWVTTLHPTQAYAQDAELSLAEYEDFVYAACHVDRDDDDPVAFWTSVQKEQARVLEALKGKGAVHIQGPHCDLTLSVKDRVFMNSSGRFNFPDGEIYTGPVEDSANGWVRFTYPSQRLGREVNGVELHFEQGRVTSATAEKNEAYLLKTLDTDAGSRYLGEFAIGTNYGIQRYTGNILFDEKIGGSFHVALGSGYPETGSTNVSAIHWDMICDLKKDSVITFDDQEVYRDGSFTV